MNKKFIKKVVKCYKDYLGNDLKSIILFGSRAREEGKESSDYDLFIVANNLPKDSFKRMMFMRRPLVRKFKEKICQYYFQKKK
jgi:predicted nucleotidyltransferase